MIKYTRGSMALKYTEFKSSLGSEKEFPVYLFEGEDAFFRERGLALLKKEYLSQPANIDNIFCY